MDLPAFVTYSQTFITNLAIERNLSPHTRRAYSSDLEQLQEFWTRLLSREKAKTPDFPEIVQQTRNIAIVWIDQAVGELFDK